MTAIQSLKTAKSLLAKAAEQPLTSEARKKLAIELAEAMLVAAEEMQTPDQHRQQQQMAQMIADPNGKQFLTSLTDQSFRSFRNSRIADQLTYLLNQFGIPSFLTGEKRFAMKLFRSLATYTPGLFVPLLKEMIRREVSRVILPGEEATLQKHIRKRQKEGVRINLNHLGEAILGEKEAKERLDIYLKDLAKPEVEYISVKISTLYSQIQLLDWEKTLEKLAKPLRQLFTAAQKERFRRADGTEVPKFVNLDMEEYRDLHLTVALFRRLLDEPAFYNFSAGIVLQSYLPDSYLIQQELTVWAMQRIANGGAPIKIRLVKGANLAMERVEASIHGWIQAPFANKIDSDANFKRMVLYGTEKHHATAAHLGIGSHNLLDIAYAMILRAERHVEADVEFEMLEGMAESMQTVVKELTGQILLYCPSASKAEFQYAMAYLIRRLDENTAPENFLHDLFHLKPESPAWKRQVEAFENSINMMEKLSKEPRRRQNRSWPLVKPDPNQPFRNEPDTDWSLRMNRQWALHLLDTYKNQTFDSIPLAIAGKLLPFQERESAVGHDPSRPGHLLYRYSLATKEQAQLAVETAKQIFQTWSRTTFHHRASILSDVAQLFREKRGDLIIAMIADGGKTIAEADSEVSEAIDFLEYYRRNAEELPLLHDLAFRPKGPTLVASPWNFPCAIPVSGIAAALVAGNTVIFKPASETVLVGWKVAQLFWQAGISKEVLQFISCEDDPVGSSLIGNSDLATIILTGATATAKLFLKIRPSLDLAAETGGKNAMVITSLSDRDLAIKDLLHSAFSHAGQKCSACSLAILEAEVYDDPKFKENLRDAAASLAVGSAWDPKTFITPLIRSPQGVLKQALTTLEPGEEWLLEPRQDPDNPNLWHPGIKWGVQPGSFTYQNELFGPVLGVMRAKDLTEAIQLANGTPYGLTAGLHSLDPREQELWSKQMVAGNCYINRTMTGAIVRRQPFGGCKESSYGPGAKAGGPNYVLQFLKHEQRALPKEESSLPNSLKPLAIFAEKHLPPEEFRIWSSSVGSYTFYWENYFSKRLDPSGILGQDNFNFYRPHSPTALYIQPGDSLLDILRSIAAAKLCQTPLTVYGSEDAIQSLRALSDAPSILLSNPELVDKAAAGEFYRIHFLQQPPADVLQALAQSPACHYRVTQPVANGRVELLKYLREVSLSINYHRYGNLGTRENELRQDANQIGCCDQENCCQGMGECCNKE